MHLKISSSQKLIFEGEISQINLPTETGEVGILEGHTPMITTLKPGLIKITPKKQVKESDFVFTKNIITISVSKGMAYTDGKTVRVVSAVATTKPEKSEEQLKAELLDMKEKIHLLKKQWSLEEVEKSLIKLGKIDADIRLSQLTKQRG